MAYPPSSKGRQGAQAPVRRGPGPAVQQAEVCGQPATQSQGDVSVDTLLQEDGNETPQIHCEMLRTGGVWRFRWMRKVLLLVVAWAV